VRRRFFIPQFSEDKAVIEGETAHHLGRVLRAQVGQLYELSDGQRVRLGQIQRVERDRIEFALIEDVPSYLPTIDITLVLSVVKFDNFEWALEKATELGVSKVVPLAAARSEKALLSAAGKRADRWNKILIEASQQSRRVRVPVLGELRSPEQSFREAGGLRLFLSEKPDAPSLRMVLEGAPDPQVTLVIGPEGGWTDEEIEAAKAVNFKEASLGRLILRTETAVIAALASLNYALTSN
jgi:16S rRNA (uracil1498-N3)-methyltransferase